MAADPDDPRPDALEQIADALLRTADSVTAVVERLGFENHFDVTEVEAEIADMVECCQGCNWWFEPGKLVPENVEAANYDDLVGHCSECREDINGAYE